MADITLHLDQNRKVFRPGESLRGKVKWHGGKIKTIELRLCWCATAWTKPHIQVVTTARLRDLDPSGECSFDLPLPAAPHSYVGSATTLYWMLEAVAFPGKLAHHVDFDLTFDDEAIHLFP
jgi:hypothetical protein